MPNLSHPLKSNDVMMATANDDALIFTASRRTVGKVYRRLDFWYRQLDEIRRERQPPIRCCPWRRPLRLRVRRVRATA
jgi:hypothetical protein